MIKQITALMCAALAVAALASCDGETERYEYPSPTLIRLEPAESPPAALYCGALGVSVELPDEWLWHARNDMNMTNEPLYSSDFSSLERVEYDEGYAIELCELWSSRDSASPSHASLLLYAEVFDGVDFEDYCTALKSTLNGRRDGYIWALSGYETDVENGMNVAVMVAAVQPPEGETRYIEEYRVYEKAPYTYVVACLTWWEGSDASLASATLARTVYSVT